MKTITVKSATSKLEALRLAKQSFAYKAVTEILNGKTQIRPCYTRGSGKWTKNQNHTIGITTILNNIGIEFILTNDAPRHSETGNLITITTKITR